jgi:hypothetical protein
MADTDQVIDDNVDEEVVDQTQDDAQEEVQEQETEEQAEDSQEQSEAEDTQEEERQPSRREQLRINNLLKKYGDPYENRAPSQNTQGIDYRKMIDADDEVYSQLDTASQQYGQQQYNQGLEEAKFLNWRTDLKIDTARVNQEHNVLDTRSDSFNPALADSINQMYLNAVGYDGKRVANPNLSYADYVDAIFELADEAASRKVESTQRNITRQASRTGLRPDGSAAKTLDLSKDPSQMSDAELDAVLAGNGLAPRKRK